jgi:hypothetical protein
MIIVITEHFIIEETGKHLSLAKRQVEGVFAVLGLFVANEASDWSHIDLYLLSILVLRGDLHLVWLPVFLELMLSEVHCLFQVLILNQLKES